MEPQPSPAPTGSESSRRRFPFLAVSLLAVLLGLLGAGVLYLVPTPIESSQLLTAEQFQRAVQPGTMTQLKWKLMRFAGPLWPKARTFVHMDFKLYATTNDAWPQPLGIPLATNRGGLQLWRVNQETLKVLKSKLAAAVGVQKLEGCSITTSDGGQAGVNVGATTNLGGKFIPLGSTFDVLPKLRDGKFEVFVDTAVTELSSRGSSIVQTNFRAACASAAADGGGLVLAGPHQFSKATQYWCVFSILQVDGKGNPARLGKTAVKD